MEKPKNRGNVRGNRGTRQKKIKGRKKWDNCNSIINEIYFKKEGKALLFFLQYSSILSKI